MHKLKETKKNILKFNIRRRIDRHNQVFIDRYLTGDINDIHFNPKLYVRNQFLFTSTVQTAPPHEDNETQVSGNMDVIPKVNTNNSNNSNNNNS